VPDAIFGDGYEGFAPARLIVHYPAAAHFISARGDGGGLSFAQGKALARTGNTFTMFLELAAPAAWIPLLDDVTFAIGGNYSVAPGQTVEIWPHFTTIQGNVSALIAAFHSTVLDNTRDLRYLHRPHREHRSDPSGRLHARWPKPVGRASRVGVRRRYLANRYRV
jgi:hypothetical protein